MKGKKNGLRLKRRGGREKREDSIKGKLKFLGKNWSFAKSEKGKGKGGF